MEERAFLENDATRSRNGLSNRDEQQAEGKRVWPKLHTINDTMPRWLQLKKVRENEVINEQIRKMEVEEEHERKKYAGVPGWKAVILSRKDEIKKIQQKQEDETRREEERLRVKWNEKPPWQKALLTKKGFQPQKKRECIEHKEKPALAESEPVTTNPHTSDDEEHGVSVVLRGSDDNSGEDEQAAVDHNSEDGGQ